MRFKAESLVGSLAVAIGVFLLALLTNRYHPMRFSGRDVGNSAVLAAFAVAFLQIHGRTKRPLRSVLYGCLASVGLFWLVCWDALIDQSGLYDVRLALAFWLGVTVIGIGGIVGIERTYRIDVQ